MSVEEQARDKAEHARTVKLDQMSAGQVSSVIDQTFLHPDATWDQVFEFIKQNQNANFRSLVVNPNHAEAAVKKHSGKIVSVVGFPMGFQRIETKAREAELLVQAGVAEIDYVIDIGTAKSGDWKLLANEAKLLVDVGVPVKAIIEAGLLSNQEKIAAAKALSDAGVAFVKTSTGFLAGGATLYDTALLSLVLEKTQTRVKASGGIRTLESLQRLLIAGADVIGTSSGLRILREAQRP